MSLTLRLRSALGASLKHLLLSLSIALLASILVFAVWYPYPYDQLAGGKALFLILIAVDVSCGPVLTFVVFDPIKPRGELWRDIGIIVVLQLSALAYGLFSMAEARPVFLAFEKDQFRVVRLPDIDREEMNKAPPALATLSWFGPKLIGTRIVSGGDPGFLKSVRMSLAGDFPAYRPSSWIEYDSQRRDVVASAKPLDQLIKKYPGEFASIQAIQAKSGVSKNQLGYLPLSARGHTDWTVLVNLADAKPVGFLHVDGW